MEDYLNQIRTLEEEIHLTSKRVDEMSIWLFLATLACWSVTEPVMKIIAVFIVLFFLIDHVITGNYSKKSYKARIKDIKERVNNSKLSEPEKNQAIGALSRYCENQLGFKKLFKTNYQYVVAALFYSGTLVLFLKQI
jgi:hypothetical protein